MKHSLSLIVAILFCAFTSTLSAKTFTVDNITYATTDSTTVKVTGTSNKYTLVIPETVTYSDTTYTVNAIGSSAFSYNSTLYTVSLPNTIKTIGYDAFYNTNITEINLPSGLTDLGEYAFESCSNLKTVTIPGTLVNWGIKTFRNSGLVEVEIEEGIQEIPYETFRGCISLKNVKLPNGLRAIKEYAFYSCKELHEIDLPETLVLIESSAFAYTGLYNIVIPDNITAIPSQCFWQCDKLQHVTLPKQLVSLEERAFASCSSLEELSLPIGTQRMECYAIEYCNSLQKVFIPESVWRINYGNFHIGDTISSHLKEVHITAKTTLPTIIMKSGTTIAENVYNPFYNSHVDSITLYVQKGTTSLYQNAMVWGEFGNIVEEDISLDIDASKTLLAGDSSPINYRISPDIFPTSSITWKSSNEKVATVNANGVVKAIASGKANITATMSTTYENETSDVCQVTVVDNVDNFLESAKPYFGDAIEKNISVGIDMTNQDNIIAFQCDIYLPEGLEFVTTDEGCDFDLSDRASRTHTIDGNIQSDGALRLVSYSARNSAFSGNSGTLFTFSVKGEADGEYSVRLANIILTNKSLKDLNIPELTVTVKVGSEYATKGGDVNLDGNVTVGDAATTVSYILEENPSPFDVSIADVNGDGIINIGDVSGIIDIILNKQENSDATTASKIPARALSEIEETDYLYADPIEVGPSSEYEVGFSLHNEARDYCAFQCDIMFPQGMTAVSEDDEVIIDLSSRKKRSHTVAAKYVSSGALRVVSYSTQNAAYSGTDGELFSVLVATDSTFSTEASEINISNIIFVNRVLDEETGKATITDCYFQDATIKVNENLTGVAVASIYNEDITLTLSGRQLTIFSPRATQLQLTSIDGKSVLIDANQGVTTYNIPSAGFYIANGQKLIVR
jgi:hypothetical protein